ncbi:hypothetical protein KNP414_06682 [Paenibacillus mucilaginosus KNP414]|uniref:Uncharacterized protein n=1 Tax=Paenibacillus mucilaginosus (strain KNP414) TaxID=1036673 RepID=F8FA03_PAEMK|nr:hypothetical protein KNP414_06682 [Paenibacillus mucilaginosus KNP414]
MILRSVVLRTKVTFKIIYPRLYQMHIRALGYMVSRSVVLRTKVTFETIYPRWYQTAYCRLLSLKAGKCKKEASTLGSGGGFLAKTAGSSSGGERKSSLPEDEVGL